MLRVLHCAGDTYSTVYFHSQEFRWLGMMAEACAKRPSFAAARVTGRVYLLCILTRHNSQTACSSSLCENNQNGYWNCCFSSRPTYHDVPTEHWTMGPNSFANPSLFPMTAAYASHLLKLRYDASLHRLCLLHAALTPEAFHSSTRRRLRLGCRAAAEITSMAPMTMIPEPVTACGVWVAAESSHPAPSLAKALWSPRLFCCWSASDGARLLPARPCGQRCGPQLHSTDRSIAAFLD